MIWRCQLLGRLTLRSLGRELTRFRTQKTALLLGCLAYHVGQWFERLTLADDLWGDGCDPDSSLRTALCSLRKQLEPPSVPAYSVLQTDDARVRLNPEAVRTDVQQFQELLQQAQATDDHADRLTALTCALQLYQGELLQDFEAAWLVQPRLRLQAAYLQALQDAVPELLRAGQTATAIALAERAVQIYPTCETASGLLARVYLSVGDRAAAEAEYARLQRATAQVWGAPPRLQWETLTSNLLQVGAEPCPPLIALRLTPPAAPAPLPTPLTRFFGREQELEHATRLLLNEDVRLLTVTGPPGVGKTRFAQELGRRLQAHYAGRIWWASLQEAHTPHEARRLIARALHCDWDADEQTLLETIRAQLGDQRGLLLADNWEQVLPAAAWLESLLQRAPNLQVVAMSRHPLELAGERQLMLSPLPMPDAHAPLEAILQNPSVALLVDRAQSVRPDFACTPANAAKLIQLCRALEGLPLAIELAGAQLGARSLTQLLQSIEQRLDWLVARRSTTGCSHRSLRAALESSYQQLSRPQQRALAALATLRGEWDESLARALLLRNAEPLLDALTRHSLLNRTFNDDTPAYSMLEAVRLFALSKPRTHAPTLQRRLFNHFYQLSKRVKREFNTTAQPQWVRLLRQLYPNLQTALDYGVRFCPRQAARMLVNYGYFLDWELRWSEATQWCQDLLAVASLPKRVRAQLLSWLGYYLLRQGQCTQAEPRLLESIQLCRAVRDSDELAGAYNMLGLAQMLQQRYEAAAQAFERGVAAARRRPQPIVLAPLMLNWGILHYLQQRYADALDYARQSCALYQQTGATLPLGNAWNLVGLCAAELGDYPDAHAALQRAVNAYQQTDYARGMVMALCNLARLSLKKGATPQAETYLRQAEQIVHTQNSTLEMQGMVELMRARQMLTQERFQDAQPILTRWRDLLAHAPMLATELAKLEAESTRQRNAATTCERP